MDNIDLPPTRFDRQSSMPVIERVLPFLEVADECRKIGIVARRGQVVYGCSYISKGKCYIIITDGTWYNTIHHHEIGHCNGWSKNHEP